MDESASPSIDSRVGKLRSNCQGLLPLQARLTPWMIEVLCTRGDELADAINRCGSPLNLISPGPMNRNIGQLDREAANRELSFKVFFARKANKCLSFVTAATQIGAGIDVASEQECQQVLDRGMPGEEIICTAAIKTGALFTLCVKRAVTIAIDNADELYRVRQTAKALGTSATVAIRVSGFRHQGDRLDSRFGFDIEELPRFAKEQLGSDSGDAIHVRGLHFHLDGYSSDQRVSASDQCLLAIDQLRSTGHDVRFLDIGGGFPTCYLESEAQWQAFWAAHRESLLGQRAPVTYKNHGLGFINIGGSIHGQRSVYPFWQSPVKEKWFAHILDAKASRGGSIAQAIRERSLQLRCEPGRSLLDGAGLTIARVEFTKRHRDGDWLIGLAMNRTQCRTSSADFLVDPLVLRCHPRPVLDYGQPMQGYLVGAYCTESELISLRKLQFPLGIAAGDLVVFPNTAGYFMHFLESRSHQFPLAANMVVQAGGQGPILTDEIDCGSERETGGLERSSNWRL
jgi:diaminopimelate decarboxylase